MMACARAARIAAVFALTAAAQMILPTSARAASETFAPPRKWHGTKIGTTDGNPAIVDGVPMWRFDGVFPEDPEEPENYTPLPWSKNGWQNTKIPQSHAARVTDGVVEIGMYGCGGGNLEFRKNNALIFIAPKDGTYALSTTIDIFRWEGGANISLRLFRRERKDDVLRLTRIERLPLEIKKGNRIDVEDILLRKGAELIILPFIDGYYSGAAATFKGLSISWNEIPGGFPEHLGTARQPARRQRRPMAGAASRSGAGASIDFPLCTERVDLTKDAGGTYRPGLHAGHSCMGVIDITKPPYSADNTGKTDVSEILTRALHENNNSGWGNKIVYLPDGVYLVTKTVRQKEGGGNIGPCLQGQSRTGTVIRLRDGTWPTDDGTRRWVLKTGDGVAQNFNRILRNLTISIGRSNDGACGLFFYGNNQASMSEIDVISEDGKGQVGLDLHDGAEQGPCMVRNTFVKGFRIGVRCAALNAVAIHNLSLEGQSEVGIQHKHHPLWVYGLKSSNRVPAVSTTRDGSFLLVDGELSGGDPDTPAMKHGGAMLFLRNVSASGYARAIDSAGREGAAPVPSGLTIDEYSPQSASLFGPPQRSLNLPVKEPPEPAWEQNMTKWASAEWYKRDGLTDAQALQAAIDDRRNTAICVPADVRITRSETVYVRGNITRIIGTGGSLIGQGSLAVVDSGPRVVKIERMALPGNTYHRSRRTAVIEAVTGTWLNHEGSGDLFVSDAPINVKVINPKAHLWMWHFNSEGRTNGLTVKDGTAWVFGWKTEGTEGGRILATGGALEVLGFLDYTSGTDKSPWPLIDIRDTDFSIAGLAQWTFGNWDREVYHRLVRETKDGVTKEHRGTSLPLYASRGKRQDSHRGR